jgi:hypothetical protein
MYYVLCIIYIMYCGFAIPLPREGLGVGSIPLPREGLGVGSIPLPREGLGVGSIPLPREGLGVGSIPLPREGLGEGLDSSDSLHDLFWYTCRQLLFRVKEHGGADAVAAVGAVEDVAVDAALTSPPEALVIGEVVEGHGKIPQLCVHLHHRRPAGQREDLGMGPSDACEGEGEVLDALGDSHSSEVGMNDQSRGGDIVFVAPRLDVAESGELLALQGDDRLSLFHLRGHVLRRALGDAGAADLCCVGDGFQYGVDIFDMTLVGHHHFDFFHGVVIYNLVLSECLFQHDVVEAF